MASVQRIVFVRPQFGNVNLAIVVGPAVIVLLMTSAVELHYWFLLCVKLLAIDMLMPSPTDIVLLTSMNSVIQLKFLVWS